MPIYFSWFITALLLVSVIQTIPNLPQSGRLFILRVIGMLPKVGVNSGSWVYASALRGGFRGACPSASIIKIPYAPTRLRRHPGGVSRDRRANRRRRPPSRRGKSYGSLHFATRPPRTVGFR